MRRPRGPNGRFLAGEVLAEYLSSHQIQPLSPPPPIPPPPSATKSFPFLSLPAELRDHIYTYLLCISTVHPSWPHIRLSPYTPNSKPGLFPSILATNHQIHNEAAQVLYGSQTIHITIADCNWTRVSEQCNEPLALLAPHYLSLITRVSISIESYSLVVGGRPKINKKIQQHLAHICTLLANNKLLSLRIIVTNVPEHIPYGEDYIGKIPNDLRRIGWRRLDAFKALQGIKQVVIEGSVDPSHARELKHCMQSETTDEGRKMRQRNAQRSTPITPKKQITEECMSDVLSENVIRK